MQLGKRWWQIKRMDHDSYVWLGFKAIVLNQVKIKEGLN